VPGRRGLDCDDALHRFDALRQRAVIEEWSLSGRVVSDVRVDAIVSHRGIRRHEHPPVAVTLAEAGKRFQPRWNEAEPLPAHGADDAFARELLPPALRLPVVHHEVRVSKLAGRSEIEGAAVQPAIENQRRVAERAVGHDDREAADGVVDDLVPDEDAHGIRASIAIDCERDDGLGGADRCAPARRPSVNKLLEPRQVDGRNSVLARTARPDLSEGDRVPREIGARPLRPPGGGAGSCKRGNRARRRAQQGRQQA
jgi:hypothetical protein